VRPSRISRARVLADLRVAARKGDRAALALALDQMRTLAHTPRYWAKYLELLGNPLARLVDLLVIKQGERIARLKGWKVSKAKPAKPAAGARPAPARKRARPAVRESLQPSLFD
jgi:hypothetical protein